MSTVQGRGRQGFWLWLLRRRTWVQFASTLATNSWFTQQFTKGVPCLALNCHACPLAAFACPVGAIQHFVGLRQIPWYVLGVVGLAGALAGRFACGWFCPFGWLQELLFKVPVPKWAIRPRERSRWWVLLIATLLYAGVGWALLQAFRPSQELLAREPFFLALYLVGGFVLYTLLGAGKFFALIGLVLVVPLITMELWFCKLCPAGMLEGGIPQVLLTADLWGLVKGLYWLKLGILLLFLAWMVVTRRPFCRWVCPLGTLWSAFNRWSALHMSVDRKACIECDRCQRVCPVDIRIYEDANAAACVRCMHCVDVCPVSCIRIEVG